MNGWDCGSQKSSLWSLSEGSQQICTGQSLRPLPAFISTIEVLKFTLRTEQAQTHGMLNSLFGQMRAPALHASGAWAVKKIWFPLFNLSLSFLTASKTILKLLTI